MRKTLICLAILGVFGVVRWPLESAATRDFKARHILPPDLHLSLREKLGQDSYAAALGGARSLVASIQNLMAFVAWETQDWGLVESRYRQITELQPRVASYWEMGAWHMAYNASGWYRYDWHGPKGDSNPEALQRLRLDLWERYIRKGRQIFADGARNNPDSWRLLEKAGMLAADPLKLPDHSLAAGYYGAAAALPGAPDRLRRFEAYEISSLPDRHSEALAKLTALYLESPRHHVPTLLGTLLDLQMEAGVPAADRVPMSAFGGSRGAVYNQLAGYTLYRRSRGSDVSPPLLAFLRAEEGALGIPPAERLPVLQEKNSQ